MPENPITVPLPQDMPTNWVYGQTIGPNGTDVGLTQQYGYNYLMQQVNAAQQAAEELGEGFTGLSGDNIPESAGSETSISASLSNKADKGPPQEYDLPLTNGVTGTAKYWKTQEGLVIIHGWILGASLGTVLATLPEGFRPKYYTIRASISSASTPSLGLIRVEVSVLGEMKITAWNDVGTIASGAAISMDFMSAD